MAQLMDLDSLTQQLLYLTEKVESLSAAASVSAPVSAPVIDDPASKPDLTVSLPERFNGDRSQFRCFMSQLRLVFMLRPTEYSSDLSKIATFGSLLSGEALKWFQPLMSKEDFLRQSWDDFLAEATAMFDEPCRVEKADARIHDLRQTGALADYISEFNSVASVLDWSESALISKFRRGLKAEILDLLLHFDVPGSLSALFALVLKLDARLDEHRSIRRHSTVPPVRRFLPL